MNNYKLLPEKYKPRNQTTSNHLINVGVNTELYCNVHMDIHSQTLSAWVKFDMGEVRKSFKYGNFNEALSWLETELWELTLLLEIRGAGTVIRELINEIKNNE